MNSCNLKDPAREALIASAKAMPRITTVSPELEDLAVSIQRNMLITGQKLVAAYDGIVNQPDPGFFAEQVKATFGLNITIMRGCITNALMLADHTPTVKAGL